MPVSMGFYGTPGIIDMPTAEQTPDAQISVTVSHMAGVTRNTIGFQVAPRLFGSVRYSSHQSNTIHNYDRSFDLLYQLRDEGKYAPAVALGLRDIIGTGWYSAEYLAATKTIGRHLKLTGGIGWGRLGSYNGFRNPLAILGRGLLTRPTGTLGLGGIPAVNRWFRGPAAFFGGAEWQTPIDRLMFKMEYSSDVYAIETAGNILSHRSPFNFALSYRTRTGATLTGYYLYGSRIGVSASISLNPKTPTAATSIGAAPLPVLTRPDDQPRDSSWTAQSDAARILRGNLALVLKQERLTLVALKVSATRARVWFRNTTYGIPAEAIGRVARAMTRTLPGSVENFIIIPVVKGIPVVAITLKRSDIEELEHAPDAANKIYARARIGDAPEPIPPKNFAVGAYPKYSWSVGPYGELSLFDPDNPVRIDVGLRLKASAELRPGLVLSGSIRKKVVGNLDTVTRLSTSALRHVRSDYGFYDKAGDPAIDYLTAEYFFRPGVNLYGRISVGYLEEMYGGLSTELLWKPTGRKLAFGVELNAVRQRAFNQLLGFRPYGVVTGHVSAYWDIGNGYYGQLDVGRYLAGDSGATFTFQRVFDNGWKVGGFFSLTNVPFTTFGEGSFNKGLMVTIPLSWVTGQPSTRRVSKTVQPLTRDGAAELNIRNRLYGLVENYRDGRLKRSWGRFWR